VTALGRGVLRADNQGKVHGYRNQLSNGREIHGHRAGILLA
jgi:hypothetical protein